MTEAEALAALRGPDRVRAGQAEAALWTMWCRSGRADLDARLGEAVAAMERRDFDEAGRLLTGLVGDAPDWAEAWNKLATLCYLQGRDDECVAAIHRALELEPRHFGALASLGEVLCSQGETEPALLAFGRALRLHPHLGAARDRIRELRAC